MMTMPSPNVYAGYRFPAEVIGYAVWLYFRFPLSLRMVEEMLAVRGVVVSHETVRRPRPTVESLDAALAERFPWSQPSPSDPVECQRS